MLEKHTFHLGLLVNPLAGLGGPAAMKGSDHLPGVPARDPQACRSGERAVQALQSLSAFRSRVTVSTWGGPMGEDWGRLAQLDTRVLGRCPSRASCASDSLEAARALRDAGVDLLLFAGGDGTARNIVDAVGDSIPVLGIPAGVKMHSGCFAISPRGAGAIVRLLLEGRLVNVGLQEVRDIDEAAFRDGAVRTRYYGELLVPEEGYFLQNVKQGGREVESLVLADIGAEVAERMAEAPDDTLYIIGPGTTPRAVMEELGLDNTLLGVDVVQGGKLRLADATAQQLEGLLAEHRGEARIILTATGGQGHLIGRGNQQLSPRVLRRVGRDNLWVVATKTKITALNGRPLWLDSHDPQLDEQWSGFIQVISGYRDTLLYPVEGV